MEKREQTQKFISDSALAAYLKTFIAPIERVKLIFQNQHVAKCNSCIQYRGILRTLVRLSREQGIISLWRGNLANVTRYVPQQFLNNLFRKEYKKIFLGNSDSNVQLQRYSVAAVASGGAAGATSLCFVYPLDYIRTRLTVDLGRNKPEREYLGMRDCFRKTYKTDGVRGLYRGLGPSLCGIVIYRAISFGILDIMKETSTHSVTVSESFLITQVVTLIAGVASYPFDTVRRRMMMQVNIHPSLVKYKTSRECWKKIVKEEGFKGFFKGCFTNMLSGSGMAIVMVVYDKVEDEN